jgi:hypothetical protein
MSANTATKARLLDLATCVLELVRDGKRSASDVCRVLQIVRDDPLFLDRFFPEQYSPDVLNDISVWQFFYKAFFGMDVDFSNVRIPERRLGFDRLLIIAKGLTPNQVYKACKRNFPCFKYTEDLDVTIKHNDRVPTDHYAIWVRDRQEADEELKNLSANQIRERRINTETLTERFIHGFKYWSETKKHLDERNITLCAGSRSQHGNVLSVEWFRGKLFVDWYNPVDLCNSDRSDRNLRSREVVS